MKDGKIILFPDIDTQIYILGFRDKREHYIEIPYDKFISEVTDIWEERTPIEGFKLAQVQHRTAIPSAGVA